jgi:histone deacetylase 11
MITLLFAFHQGNGPERDFLDDDRVYIFDMFNRQIYPQDGFAKSLYFLVTV